MNKNPDTQQVKHLFFARKSSQLILRFNYEMLILDVIYKTNRYKLSLFIIIEITTLNFFFYVGFIFMKLKYISNYVWIMKQLKALYDEFKISYSNVLLTNCQEILINVCDIVFPDIDRMFCI